MTDAPKWRSDIERCAMCGKCRSVCPVFQETGDEALVARGRIRLARALAEDEEASGRLAYALKSCIRCMKCQDQCPSGVAYREIISGARREMAEKRGVALPVRIALRHIVTRPRVFRAGLMTARLFQKLLPAGRGGNLRHLPLFLKSPSWVPEVAPRSAVELLRDIEKPKSPRMRVGLFTGCLINHIYPEMATAAARVLKRMSVEVVAPPEQVCCGTPAVSFGEVEGLKRVAGRNAEVFSSLHVDAVITPCATCGSTLKHEYEDILGRKDWAGSPIMDAMEFICREGRDLLESLDGDETDSVRLTYHDPCHMIYGQGLSAEPRAVLKRCGELVEMSGKGNCCGGGGTFEVFFPELSGKITARKVAAISATGAMTVATACPGCALHINSALAAAGMPCRSRHAIELLDEALERMERKEPAASPKADTDANKTVRTLR
ncbi:MAG TPA: (Fe-S)-binding protein [Candidatus Brocadiia bacterium]|nr:(Fe-S)-binding protein [Candidatus Brocadiia bacterium]